MKKIFCIGAFVLFLFTLINSCKKDVPADSTKTVTSNDFPNDGAIVLSDDITHDTILINHKQGVDYRIAICMKVTNGARLIIQPGVTIEMTPGSGIEISDAASIDWQGNANEKINILGLEKTRGSWRGIYLYSKGVTQIMKHCIIQHAGSDIYKIEKRSCINVLGASVSMENCTIKDNFANGLYLDSAAVNIGIHNNTFTGNYAEPVMIDHVNCDILTNDNLYTGNTFDRIYIRTIRNLQTYRTLNIPKLDVPYTVDSTFNIGTSVIIQPGTKFIMQKLSLFYANDSLQNGASFTAIGTTNNRIEFVGQLGKKGYWQGIGLDIGATCHFENCDIKYCGFANNYNSSNPEAMIIIGGNTNTNCEIRNCIFSYSAANGIAIDSPSVNFNADIYTVNSFDSIDFANVLIY